MTWSKLPEEATLVIQKRTTKPHTCIECGNNGCCWSVRIYIGGCYSESVFLCEACKQKAGLDRPHIRDPIPEFNPSTTSIQYCRFQNNNKEVYLCVDCDRKATWVARLLENFVSVGRICFCDEHKEEFRLKRGTRPRVKKPHTPPQIKRKEPNVPITNYNLYSLQKKVFQNEEALRLLREASAIRKEAGRMSIRADMTRGNFTDPDGKSRKAITRDEKMEASIEYRKALMEINKLHDKAMELKEKAEKIEFGLGEEND